jgi:hypothetical protein
VADDPDGLGGGGPAARPVAPVPPPREDRPASASAPPRYVVEALRVTWSLAGGGRREHLIRLAEPAGTGAAFAEHLRWHTEGLDHVLAPLPVDRGRDTADPGRAVVYEPLEPHEGVVGIALEAVGIGLPSGTQLRLLAPLQLVGAAAMARVDPTTRARNARRAIARARARWGPAAAAGASVAAARLPEARHQVVEPQIGLQVDEPNARSARTSGAGAVTSIRRAPAVDAAAPVGDGLPMWLVDDPEPVAILTPRRGGRRVLVRRAPVPVPGQPPPRGPQHLRIVRFGGPWRLVDSSALTSQEPLQRDYYQVETEDGGAFLLYWDRAADQWFLQGLFA